MVAVGADGAFDVAGADGAPGNCGNAKLGACATAIAAAPPASSAANPIIPIGFR